MNRWLRKEFGWNYKEWNQRIYRWELFWGIVFALGAGIWLAIGDYFFSVFWLLCALVSGMRVRRLGQLRQKLEEHRAKKNKLYGGDR